MTTPANNRRLAWKLAFFAMAMIGFGYLLVPLYQVYCTRTGFNGTTGRIDYGDAVKRKVDTARWVTVEFVANVSGNLPWEFHPEVVRLKVHPGDLVLTRFHARNLGNAAIVGQAIPNVTPGEAAPYFHKIECFCFSQQPLAPGEGKDLPLQFQVDPQLPTTIGTLTLSYTFFEAPGVRADRRPAGDAARG
ncbi:MAG: cytochrome c oxidase assembly protein [Rhodocyclaceae bacterium]|nr:cytochrome c oxidase assembly protein [Rhodocyclaceae bacterium]